jgi:hypothetical protein
MSEEQNAYDVVLADLLAQRERLDAAIAAIQALKGGGGPTGSGGSNAATQTGNGSGSTKIESDSFFGLTILEAAKKYLSMVKRPQKAGAITEALKQGGYTFSTSSPLPVVASLLNRDDAKGGEIVRVSKGMFGLASWYKTRPKRGKSPDGDDTPEAPSS